MVYAINLADWVGHKTDIGLAILLQAVIEPGQDVVETERGKFDGMGMILQCDEERAGAIVEFIRKRYKRHELRCYRSRTGQGGWKRL